MTVKTTGTVHPQYSAGNSTDNEAYDVFVDTLQENFKRNTEALGHTALLTVGPSQLFSVYLRNIDSAFRQANHCTACSEFFRRYAGIVSVDPNTGTKTSMVWNIDESVIPRDLRAAVAAVRRAVEASDVVGIVVPESEWLGIDRNDYRHISVRVGAAFVWDSTTNKLNAEQRAAELIESARTLVNNIQNWQADALREAVRQLTVNDKLNQTEKFLARAKWTLDLRERLDAVPAGSGRAQRRQNIMWLAGVTAPAGWSSITNSALGILLKAISEHKSERDMVALWNTSVNEGYMRPVSAPAAATVKAAEAAFGKLGLAPATRRRFATLQDVQYRIWEPAVLIAAPKAAATGLFAGVKTKDEKPAVKPVSVNTAPVSVTWSKFVSKHLPGAAKLEVRVPSIGDFFVFTAAADPTAPPILKWDKIDRRNTVAMFRYVRPRPAPTFGLVPDSFVPVTAVTTHPAHWSNPERDYVEAFLILRGCVDSLESGLGMFPEDMHSELHEFRAVIEAFSRNGTLEGHDEATACGLAVNSNLKVKPVHLRATDASGVVTDFLVDRFD